MLIKLTYGDVDINIELKYKTNLLAGGSGEGKTLLMKAIQSYCIDNSITCAYIDYTRINDTSDEIYKACKGRRFILLDNADLYINHDLFEKINKLEGIILISLKQTYKIPMSKVKRYRVVYNESNLHIEEIS